MAEIDNIPEMRPSFDNIRRQDGGGNEYSSSRDLALLWAIRLIGNSKES